MSSSPRNPTNTARDTADGLSTAAAWALMVTLGAGIACFLGGRDRGPDPGEARIYPEMVLELAPAPMPAIEAPPPEPVAEPPPEVIPEPDPLPEPEPVVEAEPVSEPEAIPPPEPLPAPAVAAQVAVEVEGNSGEEDAIRAEWLGELRRRIEESKFYPGAARYSKETGTVLLRVEIGAGGGIGEVRILENSGSALLVNGARDILRRAAEKPLGTNTLPEGFQVDVPITYELRRW